MARATTKTWLPLDTWAAIMGLNPLHFNGLVSSTMFPATVCGQPWKQFAWQDADKISREDLAEVIRSAELQIAGELGYNLIPDWTIAERVSTVRPADPMLYNANALNIRGQRASIQAEKAHIISGGKLVKSLITAATAITRTDSNGDGYDDVMTIAVTTTITDADEIKVYYPGESGADEWEIRPLKTVTFSGGVATITFNAWQLVDPDEQSKIATDGDAQGLAAETAGNYLTTADVYRVYNDPQSQVQFLWEGIGNVFAACSCGGANCSTCGFDAQDGCLMVRDERLGILSYAAATWDSDDEEFDVTALSVGRNPDQLRLWYYSGWRDLSLDTPNKTMDRHWQLAVAFYAASLLDRSTCGCNNFEAQINFWRRDKSRSGGDLGFTISPHQLDNPFGTTEGAHYALRRVDEPGRKVGR